MYTYPTIVVLKAPVPIIATNYDELEPLIFGAKIANAAHANWSNSYHPSPQRSVNFCFCKVETCDSNY